MFCHLIEINTDSLNNPNKSEEKPWACYAELPPLQKPSVEIHYEPLNVGCRDFVVNQLDHLKTHIDEIVSLDILPFGRTNNSMPFVCPNDDGCHTYKQHVSQTIINYFYEQKLNCFILIKACIMDRLLQNHTIETLNFLICAFGPRINDESAVEECLNENFVDIFTQIDLCAHNEGDQLLQKLADRVSGLNPPLSHVPWILVNGEHNMEAEDNLIQEICDTYYPVSH